MPEKYKRKSNTKCIQCLKPIYKRPGIIKLNMGRVFCSQECFGKSCRNEHPCIICKKPILASAHKKTCSRSCANKNRTGISYNTDRPNDKIKSQKTVRLRLIGRKGKRCEKCGYSNVGILQVHHVDRNRKNNKPDNLELLCPNCHAEKHYMEKN